MGMTMAMMALWWSPVVGLQGLALKEATFRGQSTPYFLGGPPSKKTSVVLVHGFGSSARQWRALAPAIAEERRVYAVNLLGLGDAEKPKDLDFSIELWAEQVAAFVEDVVVGDCVLVGNSLGSVVALRAAQMMRPGVKGLGLFNCAIGMNSKAPPLNWREALRFPQATLARPLFALIDLLLLDSTIASYFFDNVATRANVETVLRNGVYRNAARVDDDLVDLFLRPAGDDGALEAFVKIFTGDPGPRPEVLAETLDDDDGDGGGKEKKTKIAVFWGNDDPVTPIDGPVGTFFRRRAEALGDPVLNPFVVFDDCGHCPFDDRPDVANPALLAWLRALLAEE